MVLKLPSCPHLLKKFSMENFIWDKVFKNGPSKICKGQSLKNLKEFGLLKVDHTPSNF